MAAGARRRLGAHQARANKWRGGGPRTWMRSWVLSESSRYFAVERMLSAWVRYLAAVASIFCTRRAMLPTTMACTKPPSIMTTDTKKRSSTARGRGGDGRSEKVTGGGAESVAGS